MTDEERITVLEKLTLEQATELMAMDILLRSLVASHPNQSELRRSLQVLTAGFANQARDHGSSTGRRPQTAVAVEIGVRSHISRWLTLLPSPPKS